MAIALQDFFKNFVGGIIIFVTGIYRVGDRIELNQKFGDVIAIGILHTTLLELREWVAGDQATGRLTVIPSGYVLSSMVNNYTKDNNFIWDELAIPITYDSDWKERSGYYRSTHCCKRDKKYGGTGRTGDFETRREILSRYVLFELVSTYCWCCDFLE